MGITDDKLNYYLSQAEHKLEEEREKNKELTKQIEQLKQDLKNIYEVGLECVNFVGMANYPERQAEAEDKLHKAYYKD